MATGFSFGAPKPAAGFGAPPAAGFGAPSAAGFGAPSAAGFGASSAAGFGFGLAASTGGLAASSAAGFGFGAPGAAGFSSPATGLLGAPASTSAFGGLGGFGASSAASTATFSLTGGLGGLGASSAACLGFGGFGGGLGASSAALGSTMAPFSGGLFGPSSAAPAATGSLFGPTLQTTQVPSPWQPLQPGQVGGQVVGGLYSDKELASQELKEIEAAYNSAPENLKYRFRALFHNLVENPQHKVKPVGVDEIRWKDALMEIGGVNNPDHLWPVEAKGFGELKSRLAVQDTAIADDQQFLEQIRELTRQVWRKHETVNEERMVRLREENEVLAGRLLRLLRRLSALESLSSRAHSLHVPPPPAHISPRLHKLRENLQQWHNALPSRAQALAAALRLRDNSLENGHTQITARLTPESITNLQQVLAQQTQALHQLTEVLRRDERDLEIIEKANRKTAAPN